MDAEYDKKFEEMKQYIPFLEKMIKRLENTRSGAVNPRQAQLDKIRSLRDLLLDKKKRMKMDNLLKCEQVLINLYAKVEQGNTLPGIKPASEAIVPADKTDLNLARNKLKTVTAKSLDPDTLPEIARATETEVGCSGTKEPALFQRRPNKGSLSPSKNSSSEKSPYKSSSKRNYTRVLQSPERSERSRLWSPSTGPPRDENLFSRRSPPRPSRRHSPSYHKRERKKSSKESHLRKSKDLNITLKVPEERLNSLNTKDILSRIINCSERDVDIATLRELRTQILGELKQTGANEDISDLILKSYKNKKTKKSQSKNKADVEEGELSDSESEAIENIYGNLVVVENDKTKDTPSNQNKSDLEQDQVSRKIQICLVINSDKEEALPESSQIQNAASNQKICDLTDFEMFDDNNCATKPTDRIRPKPPEPAYSTKNKDVVKSASQKTSTSLSPVKSNDMNSTGIISINDVDIEKDKSAKYTGNIDMNDFDIQENSNINTLNENPKPAPEPVPVPFKVNFYNSNNSDANEINTPSDHNAKNSPKKTLDASSEKLPELKKSLDKSEVDQASDKGLETVGINSETTKNTNKNVISTDKSSTESIPKPDAEIPLLNEPTVQPAKKDIVSEIDILQALKNEILSDTISLPCAEAITPALHQPKVTKVSNAQEELPKKRISIENYKKKSVSTNKPSLFVKTPRTSESRKESMKLQSLKLTEKEVERFNLISKIALSDDSDDERDTALKSPDDEDFAPKSPDMDITDDTLVSPPVIIPADPVKMVVANSKADVDMRQLPPLMSPNTMSPFAPSTPSQAKSDAILEVRKPVDKPEVKKPVAPVDPRIRKDALLPTPPVAYPNMTPSRNPAPNMTPNRAPNMTPSRTPNMTPDSRSFDFNTNRPFNNDDNGRKHVYAPMFPAQDNSNDRKSVWESSERSPADTSSWEMSNADREKNSGRKWDDRNSRGSHPQRDGGPRSRFNDPNYDTGYNRSRNDRNSRDEYHRQEGQQQSNYYSRSDCPSTPTPSFGRGDAPSTPSHYFGRSECPRTPSHPFGRSESSNHSFGMSDPPRTPSHPFGRSEAPMTPNHPFGRSDAPMTPSHPFGRSEAPLTPSHPFGRSEAPMTPSHPFGRSDYSYPNPSPKYGKASHDPRLNRSYDNEANSSRRDSGSYNDRNRYQRNDPRNFNREQSVPRNEPKPYTPDQTYRRDQMSCREASVGRSVPSENDRERLYSRDRSRGPDNYTEVSSRRPFQREPSAGRSMPDYRARASSVGRSVRNELSVESHAGRAFTIDTSVNSTFQKFLDSHRNNDNNFDARRQRASSVGRSLVRESSVGRALPANSFHRMEDNNRDRFKRAQSVGRELSTTRTEKSFKDLKAEFESYRNNDRKLNQDSHPTKSKDTTNSRDPRIRRDSYDKQPDTKHGLNRTQGRESYEKTKKFNYRDPRQRKEQKLNERSNYSHDRKRAESRERHSYGISSDSGIKTPTISSVKNYKIPKIKRPEPEPQPVEPTKNIAVKIDKKSSPSVVKDEKQKPAVQAKVEKKIKEGKKKTDNASNKTTHDDKHNLTAKTNKKEDDEDKNELCEAKSEKRVTRRSGRKIEETPSSVEPEEEVVKARPRRVKKVVYDSDSDDSESKSNPATKNTSPKKSPTKSKTKRNVIQSGKNVNPQDDNTEISTKESSSKNENANEVNEPEDKLDSSFGLDGIDLFPDNIISDPVLDNINSLIADLDNDLATSKSGACNDLFNDISIETMLEKITSSPLKKETKQTLAETTETVDALKTESNKTVSENKDLFDSLKIETDKTDCEKSLIVAGDKKEESSNQVTDEQTTRLSLILKDTESQSDCQSKIISQTQDKNDPEPVVSTSLNEEESSKNDQSLINDKTLDGQSTPDSTNEAENMSLEYSEPTGHKPDSTIEKQCEMNSDISSTHDAENKPTKDNVETPKDPAPQIDSIGSLLSILQDKSKIKELLSMLGDQSGENEKIKKKLEKLSEIVSDEEDTSDDKIEENTSNIKASEDNSEIEHAKQDNEEDVEKLTPKDDTEPHQPLATKTCQLSDSNPDAENEAGKTNDHSESKIASVDNITENVSEEKNVESQVVTDSIETSQVLDEKEVSKETLTEDNSEHEDNNDEEGVKESGNVQTRKKVVRRGLKRFKTGKFKKGKQVKSVGEEKRVTRSEAAGLLAKPKLKKPSRELRQLQESIKEMFVSDAILNATGIRMCRLAKMIDEKSEKSDDLESSQSEVSQPEPNKAEPRVVLEKVKNIEESVIEKPLRKKPGPKPKGKPAIVSPDEKKNKDEKPLVKYKPGPKSKTKILQNEKDPYDFETDSINESKSSEKGQDSGSDSENESLASSKSFGSTELLVELKKKPKRKRGGGWQSGVIKPKKKRKVEVKRAQSPPRNQVPRLNVLTRYQITAASLIKTIVSLKVLPNISVGCVYQLTVGKT
ncbi:serine/arginine repetitive matrix protein 2-like [Leguminivora glycinivorella]|uniref:serine/arginine repetitive matrix protein 2-like n=1 Tax=Leguminivora glycinivorella TaxID=1035111 RepID=UPI00200DD092|nr:serine/arginine repetitive matrix protein 2-like [Leguminivora glycinivorella]XP_047998887.1 serine/arginine repetitive matrix protein 2-like [Leguminivora glycinivorella]XP_047998888.1 serine/arginine repetitive matrix protein 2-like [Leguminivora glycinivorella]